MNRSFLLDMLAWAKRAWNSEASITSRASFINGEVRHCSEAAAGVNRMMDMREMGEHLSTLHGVLLHQPGWVLFLAAVGFFRVAKACVSFFRWAYVYFLRPSRDLRRSYGSWALVTGPTDGIGKAMALRLAGEGLNLVLVGRNPDKLTAVSAFIKAAHPKVLLQTVVLDLAGDTSEGIRRVGQLAEELDLGVVVNNAGVAFSRPLYFHEVEERTWMEVVKVNLEGPTAVIRAVLPAMRRRRRGAIVNIGSASGGKLPTFPFYSIYSATKLYINVLSRSLDLEYKESGIRVQCQIPNVVATKIVDGLMPRLDYWVLASTAGAYARASLRWIGHDSLCVPYWPHSFQFFLSRLVPDSLLDIWLTAVCGNSRERLA